MVCLAVAGGGRAEEATSRPANWAQPVVVAGIGNCHRVTTNLYRGAQPTAEGLKHLQALGVKTVISLRDLHSDKDVVAGTGLKLVRLKMEPWHSDEDEVVRFLRAATDTNNVPVFVHCERGADRTGTMCAMYRIVVCGWTKEQALDEMKRGGFGFNPLWQNLVYFIEKADIAEIKRRAGLAEK
ncbi:MAG: tyrosine-protein phosphatase [Verrucomicrobiae bacterium]|nr:tyrosine-protein phosphatase [Verrucomicrobiae bacterium]